MCLIADALVVAHETIVAPGSLLYAIKCGPGKQLLIGFSLWVAHTSAMGFAIFYHMRQQSSYQAVALSRFWVLRVGPLTRLCPT